MYPYLNIMRKEIINVVLTIILQLFICGLIALCYKTLISTGMFTPKAAEGFKLLTVFIAGMIVGNTEVTS